MMLRWISSVPPAAELIIEAASRDIGTSCQKEADAVLERAIIAMDTSGPPQESSFRNGGTWLPVSRAAVL